MALVYKLSGTGIGSPIYSSEKLLMALDFNTQSGYWLQVQLSVAIVCICLPTLRPLMHQGSPFLAKLRTYCQSLFGFSTQGSKWTSKQGGFDDKNDFSRAAGGKGNMYKNLGEGFSDHTILTSVTSGDGRNDASRASEYPMDAIAVEHHVDVV